MDDETLYAIERACERLVIAASHRSDEHDHRLADLFAIDGVLDVAGTRHEGREQIRSAVAARDRGVLTHHIISNILVDVLSQERARSLAYVTAYVAPRGEGGPASVSAAAVLGHYHDEFVLTPEGWRIAHRRLEVVMRGS